MTPMPRTGAFGYCRRSSPRYQFYVEAEIVWRSETRWGRVSNISRGGMFVEIADPPSLGAYFPAYLALDQPLRVDCLVRRVVPRRGVAVSMTVPEEEIPRFEALLVALARGSDPAVSGAAVPRSEPPHVKAASAAMKL